MLFQEGFAQRFEHWLLGVEIWNLSKGINDDKWLTWCKENGCRLAALYLDMTEGNMATDCFFGDWLDVEGRKHVGYYLGHELIRSLEPKMSIREIAALEDVDAAVESFLRRMAEREV